MKLRKIVRAAAEDDIRDIADYIARDNSGAARLFDKELREKIEYLSEFPRTGHLLGRFEEELLAARISNRFKRYLVIYFLEGNEALHIIRVLHGARDIAAELSEIE